MQHASLPEMPARLFAANPADDDAECIVTSLALAILCCHLHAADRVRNNLAQAALHVRRLSRHAMTVRPQRPIRLARISATDGSQTDMLLLPIVRGEPSVPSIDLHSLVKGNRGILSDLPAVSLTNVDIAYFRCRIRTARVAVALASLESCRDLEKIQLHTLQILSGCLPPDVGGTDPLDVADDYFALARGFIRLNQAPLATMPLHRARMCLESYAGSAHMVSHVATVADVKDKLVAICNELTAAAS